MTFGPAYTKEKLTDKYQDEALASILAEVDRIGYFKVRLGDLKEEIRRLLLNAFDAGYERKEKETE